MGCEGAELRKWVEDERLSLRVERALAREFREHEIGRFQMELESIQLCMEEAVDCVYGPRTGERRESGDARRASTGIQLTGLHKLISPFDDNRNKESTMGKAEAGFIVQHELSGVHYIQIHDFTITHSCAPATRVLIFHFFFFSVVRHRFKVLSVLTLVI